MDESSKIDDAGRPANAKKIQNWRLIKIKSINSNVVEKGRLIGVVRPMGNGIVDFVRRIEQGTLVPGEDNVSRLAARFGI